MDNRGATTTISNFSSVFQYLIYIGLVSAAAIDCTLAVAISFVLLYAEQDANVGDKRTHQIIMHLIFQLIGAGMLTAASCLAIMGLYWSNPSSMVYLTVTFFSPRLYSNSILALFNAKARLNRKLNAYPELRSYSTIFFGETQGILLQANDEQLAYDVSEVRKGKIGRRADTSDDLKSIHRSGCRSTLVPGTSAKSYNAGAIRRRAGSY
ncbi:hypothetical protein GALMADRAFT_148360 [Galerina marginata CBS 339.88]|uniref:DUF6534 domain-containing protein n=1 Tax=Galerina marginata (strain CBS 339.88) TaxID=685588 RepID=A0A067S4Y5_GALM3|nr:hypothetical protein GALMADRAFT_148360 [Galerina marginata CBS 339.88]